VQSATATPRCVMLSKTGTALQAYLATNLGMQLHSFTLPPPAPGRFDAWVPEERGVVSLSIAPEPARREARLRFALSHKGPVQLALYDLMGRRVDSILDRVMAPGIHSMTWDRKQLRSGVYFLRMQFDKEILTRRVTLLQ